MSAFSGGRLVGWMLPLLASTVDVGDPVGSIVLTDMDYLPRELTELGEAEAYVLVFTTTDCPIATRYLPRIVALEATYRDQGVRFALIDVGAEPIVEVAAAYRLDAGVDFPVFKDTDLSAVAATGVTRTPECVVLDGDLTLVYRGRVDDQYRLGGARPTATRHDLRDAIDALLDGREVERSTTPVDGCLITTADPLDDETSTPTWSGGVAEVVHRSCVECHHAQGEAPFPLVSHRDAARRADMIAEVVSLRRMPPWFASARHGEFENTRRLDEEDVDLVLRWARGGAPLGDADAVPKSPKLPDDEWKIGEPDLVLAQVGETSLPADGYVPYQYVLLPHVFLRDTWIQGVQIRCDNKPVMHHAANLAYVKVGDGYKPDHFITGQVPGGDPMILRRRPGGEDPSRVGARPAGALRHQRTRGAGRN